MLDHTQQRVRVTATGLDVGSGGRPRRPGLPGGRPPLCYSPQVSSNPLGLCRPHRRGGAPPAPFRSGKPPRRTARPRAQTTLTCQAGRGRPGERTAPAVSRARHGRLLCSLTVFSGASAPAGRLPSDPHPPGVPPQPCCHPGPRPHTPARPRAPATPALRAAGHALRLPSG